MCLKFLKTLIITKKDDKKIKKSDLTRDIEKNIDNFMDVPDNTKTMLKDDIKEKIKTGEISYNKPLKLK